MGMPDRVHPNDEERGDAHPLPVSRRRFLQRSAMAVAGGVLFSCTGGRVIRSVTPSPSTVDRHAVADQTGHLRDAREPELRQPVRPVPGRERHDHRACRYGKEQPLIACPDWMPGDLPHDRAAGLNCLNGGKMDGFGGGKWGAVYGYSQFHEPQIPNYYRLGEGVRALGQLLRVGAGTVVPEPLLLHRRAVGRRDRQPREHRLTERAKDGTTRSTRAGAATRSATTSSSS